MRLSSPSPLYCPIVSCTILSCLALPCFALLYFPFFFLFYLFFYSFAFFVFRDTYAPFIRIAPIFLRPYVIFDLYPFQLSFSSTQYTAVLIFKKNRAENIGTRSFFFLFSIFFSKKSEKVSAVNNRRICGIVI